MYQIYWHLNEGIQEIRRNAVSRKYLSRKKAEIMMRRMELNDHPFWELISIYDIEGINKIVHLTPVLYGHNGKQIDNLYKWYSVEFVK